MIPDLPPRYRLEIAHTAAEVAAHVDEKFPGVPGFRKRRIAVAEGMRRLKLAGMDRRTHDAARDLLSVGYTGHAGPVELGSEWEPAVDEGLEDDPQRSPCCDPAVWALVRELLVLALESAIQAWKVSASGARS